MNQWHEWMNEWMNEWKYSDLKCVRKPASSRLSLTHWLRMNITGCWILLWLNFSIITSASDTSAFIFLYVSLAFKLLLLPHQSCAVWVTTEDGKCRVVTPIQHQQCASKQYILQQKLSVQGLSSWREPRGRPSLLMCGLRVLLTAPNKRAPKSEQTVVVVTIGFDWFSFCSCWTGRFPASAFLQR